MVNAGPTRVFNGVAHLTPAVRGEASPLRDEPMGLDGDDPASLSCSETKAAIKYERIRPMPNQL